MMTRLLGFLLAGLLAAQACFGQTVADLSPSTEIAVRELGWRPDADAVLQVASKLPRVYFQQAAQLADDSDTTTALLYRFLQKELKVDRLQPRNQGNVGSCVGYGTSHAIDLLTSTQIWHLKKRERFHRTHAPSIYAIGRQHAGQLGLWDGSTGAWSIGGIRELGTLYQIRYPTKDLTEERSAEAKALAATGLPKELLDEAGAHKVLAAVLLKDAKQLRGAIQNGYPAIICSNVGFENGTGGSTTQRDELGFATARGTWNHCMCVCAYRGPDTGREGFLIWNSWAPSFVRGPPWPEDMPHGSFWCDFPTMERIINQRDSWAIASIEGFKKRELSWAEVLSESGGSRRTEFDE